MYNIRYSKLLVLLNIVISREIWGWVAPLIPQLRFSTDNNFSAP